MSEPVGEEESRASFSVSFSIYPYMHIATREGTYTVAAAAQKPATLVCGCTERWRMRCSPQRGRDVAPTRSPRDGFGDFPRSRFFFTGCFATCRYFEENYERYWKKKVDFYTRQGPMTNLWDYNRARAYRGRSEKEAGFSTTSACAREVHGETLFWL